MWKCKAVQLVVRRGAFFLLNSLYSRVEAVKLAVRLGSVFYWTPCIFESKPESSDSKMTVSFFLENLVPINQITSCDVAEYSESKFNKTLFFFFSSGYLIVWLPQKTLSLVLSVMCRWHFPYITDRTSIFTRFHVLTADFNLHVLNFLVRIVCVLLWLLLADGRDRLGDVISQVNV